jgi:hypothetical protein
MGGGAPPPRWENFELKNAAGTGVNGSGAYSTDYTITDRWVWVNCYSHNNNVGGFNTDNSGLRIGTFVRCIAESNGGIGFRSGILYIGCVAKDNGGVGFGATIDNSVLYGCVSIGNTGNGYVPSESTTVLNAVLGCVLDGNADGIHSNNTNVQVWCVGVRITNNTVGIDAAGLINVAYSYMPDTGEDRVNTTSTTGNVENLTLDGSDTNVFDGTDTNAGYNAPGSDDFNLVAGATLRATEIDLDGTNSVFVTAGLEPAEPASGGTTIIQRPRRVM